MACNTKPYEWFNADDIPTNLQYDRWFGYVYNAQLEDSQLAPWQEKASEKADVNPLYPDKATASQQALQYISLMEHHQMVYRSKQSGKTKKSPGGAATGAAHACPFFKIKGKCKHGDVTGCAADIHDSRKPFESKVVGQDARKKWGRRQRQR